MPLTLTPSQQAMSKTIEVTLSLGGQPSMSTSLPLAAIPGLTMHLHELAKSCAGTAITATPKRKRGRPRKNHVEIIPPNPPAKDPKPEPVQIVSKNPTGSYDADNDPLTAAEKRTYEASQRRAEKNDRKAKAKRYKREQPKKMLSPAEAVEVCQLITSGEDFVSIANSYDVTFPAIHSMALGLSWTWLTGFEHHTGRPKGSKLHPRYYNRTPSGKINRRGVIVQNTRNNSALSRKNQNHVQALRNAVGVA